jgi:hypothetical protein
MIIPGKQPEYTPKTADAQSGFLDAKNNGLCIPLWNLIALGRV